MKVSGRFFAACGAVLLLGGCGGGTSSQNGNIPSASPLAGNWLIVGPMPSEGFTVGQPSPFRMAVTLDVAGDGVAATGFANDNCNGGKTAVSYELAGATGSIASDGSFIVQTSPTPISNQSVVIRGSLPKTSGGPWPGTYSAAITSLSGTGCQTASSGSFTAISFPLVDGVYAGTATWAPSIGTSCTFSSAGTTCTPTTVSGTPAITTMTLVVTLKQGGTATDVRGNTIRGNSVLTGSIKVQGSPCFTSGTTGSNSSSVVRGNKISMSFAMDDGSTLTLSGTLTDASEAKVTTTLVALHGGQCGGNPAPVLFRLPELDLQS